jgi:hypothetical protein
LREYPRYEVKLTARLEHHGRFSEVTVYDVSEGGTRIDFVDKLMVGDHVDLTFPGMKAISGTIVRISGDNMGVSFAPSKLRPEELRDLVTAVERAA